MTTTPIARQGCTRPLVTSTAAGYTRAFVALQQVARSRTDTQLASAVPELAKMH
jgi:hypothetical protein